MIYYVSDTHFGHAGILAHQSDRARLFPTVREMDDTLIQQINLVVQPWDELYHLGDFCWQASRAGHYRQRLKVRKLHIIRGNHDSSSLKNHCSTFQDMLCKKVRLPGFNQTLKFHLLHYPMLTWDALHYGGIHLYGHSHGTYETQLDQLFPGRRSMDVGVDNLYRLTGMWSPISIDEVLIRLGVKQPVTRIEKLFKDI